MKHCGKLNSSTRPFEPELDGLLHPARVFGAPRDVVDNTNLTLDEKRAILASWASDACAVEAAPALRRAPGAGQIVTVDEILEALCLLDRQSRNTAKSGKTIPRGRDPLEAGAVRRSAVSLN
jgi:hypothetical protein